MATETKSAEPPAKRSLLIPMLLVGNALLIAAVLAVVVLKLGVAPSSGAAKEPAEAAEANPEGGGPEAQGAPGSAGSGVGPIVKLPDFVVRLRNPDIDRYARITFELELVSELDRERISPYLPKIRDGFIAAISDLNVEELRGSEGLTHLKTILTKRIDELLPTRSVRAIYVSNLIVQ